MDRIILKEMAFYAYHGAIAAERERGQVFFVDLEVLCDLRDAARTDTLSDTIDYRELYERVRAVVTGPTVHLLETVAERIAAQVLEIGAVRGVTVEIRKPHVKLGGALSYAAVRIERASEPQIRESLV
jgi:dihydroneopterin aldolase